MKCPACGSEMKSRPSLYGGQFLEWECLGCGSWFEQKLKDGEK